MDRGQGPLPGGGEGDRGATPSREVHLVTVAELCAGAVERWLESQAAVLEGLARWPQIRAMSTQKIMPLLPDIHELLPDFKGGVYVLDQDGCVMASHPVDIVGDEFRFRPYFQHCEKYQEWCLCRSFDSADRDYDVMVLAAPVFSRGRWIGIIDAVLDVQRGGLDPAIPDVSSLEDGGLGWTVVIVDEKGKVVGAKSTAELTVELDGHVADVVPDRVRAALLSGESSVVMTEDGRHYVKRDLPFEFALIAMDHVREEMVG